MIPKQMLIGWFAIVLLGLGYSVFDHHVIRTAQAEVADLRRLQEELTAWRLTATEAITRLDAQERLQYGKPVPHTIIGFYNTRLETYSASWMGPHRAMGNLAYDAVPGGIADYIFCATRSATGDIVSVRYAGIPGETYPNALPCTSP